MQQITREEAEVLAVMLDSASKKIARVKDRVPGTDRWDYVWANPYAQVRDMYEGFYAVVPPEYGICL